MIYLDHFLCKSIMHAGPATCIWNEERSRHTLVKQTACKIHPTYTHQRRSWSKFEPKKLETDLLRRKVTY